MKILLAGEGHGFESLIRGFSNATFETYIFEGPRNTEIPSNFKIDSRSSLGEIASDYDYILTSGLPKKIPASTLNKSTFINIHYALFPKYRGMHSIVWALLNGEDNIGITIHEMDDGLDSGPIIWQDKIQVGEKTSWELMVACDQYIEKNICGVMEKYLAKEILPRVQDHNLATFVGRRNLEDCRVNWNTWDVKFFERCLKALVNPYPLPFFEYKHVVYKIHKARIIHNDYIEINGHVVSLTQKSAIVKIESGLIEIFELQTNSNDIVQANQILDKIGIRLDSKPA